MPDITFNEVEYYEKCAVWQDTGIFFLKKDGTVEHLAFADDDNYIDLPADCKNIIKLAGGKSGAIACLKADGTVIVSGFDRKIADKVSKWNNITNIITLFSAGKWIIAGLKSDGTVVVAEDDEVTSYESAAKNWSNITSITACDISYHNCIFGLKADGVVVVTDAYGRSLKGISDWKNIMKIYDGGFGLKNDRTVYQAGVYPNMAVAAWKDIVSLYAENSSCIFGVRSDGTTVDTLNGHGYCTDKKIVMTVGKAALCADGTVVSENYDGGKAVYDLDGWNNIVSILRNGDDIIGIKSDGTVMAGHFGSGQLEPAAFDVSALTNIGLPAIETSVKLTLQTRILPCDYDFNEIADDLGALIDDIDESKTIMIDEFQSAVSDYESKAEKYIYTINDPQKVARYLYLAPDSDKAKKIYDSVVKLQQTLAEALSTVKKKAKALKSNPRLSDIVNDTDIAATKNKVEAIDSVLQEPLEKVKEFI